MKELASVSRTPSQIFFVGGSTAVLLGWRDSTIDIDLIIVPETDELLRSLPELKERLHVNIELASPDDFIPELPGWKERSTFVTLEGKLSFYHYDFYAQALAKIERRHQLDLQDVDNLIASGLVDPDRLLEMFSRIEDQLHRYPELDAKSFRAAVEQVVADAKKKRG